VPNLARLLEARFMRARAANIAPPVEVSSAPHAVSTGTAQQNIFTASKFRATVGDALSGWIFLFGAAVCHIPSIQSNRGFGIRMNRSLQGALYAFYLIVFHVIFFELGT
jgi:hypothetical protein